MASNWQDIRQQAHTDVLAYMSIMRPETKLGPQHYLFRDIISELYSRKTRFICLSCPPRHSKSWTFSQALPAWWLGNAPKDQVIATSYAASLAQSFGSAVRADMSTDLYGQIFSKDSQPNGRGSSGTDFGTQAGGQYKATGVGGPLTGFGGDLIIVDDPTKNAETADSPTYKAMLEKFFGETLYTRLMPNGVIVVMMTRWRQDDLTGYILKNFPDWLHVNVPAIVEEQDIGTPGALGRCLGEALWPEFFTATDLARTRKVLHEGPFQALYQGRPVSAKGGTLSAASIRWYDGSNEGTLGRPVHRLHSWDTALTKGQSSDWTVGQSWLLYSNGKLVQESYVRMKGTMPEVQQAITDRWLDYSARDTLLYSCIGTTVLIEHSHMGIGLLDQLAIAEPEMPVELWKPGHYGNKLDRLQHTLSDWNAGLVYLVRDMSEDFVDCLDELLKAGATAHDDYLDAATQAILWARLFNATGGRHENAQLVQVARATSTAGLGGVRRRWAKSY